MPQRPQSEIEYKRAYAKVASAAGLTKEQVVRIYGFEAGGNGTYDVLGARASTTALGLQPAFEYNQRGNVAINSSNVLKAKATKLSGAPKKTLESKIDVLQRIVDFSRTVPDDWSEHQKLAKTPKGLGIHSMNLDIDIGPLLQTQKLINSVIFADQKGFKGILSAAELEMMNLTGDGQRIRYGHAGGRTM